MNLIPGTDHGRLFLLAPADVFVPDCLTDVEWNPLRHGVLMAGLQRLRGRVYLADGAIERSDLTPDGRYAQPADEKAWHLIAVDKRAEVCGCARYMAHSAHLRFADTGVSNSPLIRSGEWASSLRTAVDSDLALARGLGIDFVEVGGWALAPELRFTGEALRIALGMFSLARLFGGCIGLTTATMRHCSSSILRRIGGQPLVARGIEIPPYFDPRYRCQMEILRFDSARPNPRFERWIEELRGHLSSVPVICGAIHSDQFAYPAPAMTAA